MALTIRPLVVLIAALLATGCGDSPSADSGAAKSDVAPSGRAAAVAGTPVNLRNATFVLPNEWHEVTVPDDQRRAFREINGPGSVDRIFSLRRDLELDRALTTSDLPVLAVSRHPVSHSNAAVDGGRFSQQPDVYRRQIDEIVGNAARTADYPPRSPRDTTLGDSTAVAYEFDGISAPFSNGGLARSLVVSAVHDTSEYGLTLFAARDKGASQKGRELLEAVRASWQWT